MELKNRYLLEPVMEDLEQTMVFMGGPRQVGKTTLARDMIGKHYKLDYFNWDKMEHRVTALKGQWPPDAQLLVLDEFHKHLKWKSWIKGEYDVNAGKYKFLLTGSARLDIYRKGGDSLQGRYHYFTLFPFSYGEMTETALDSNLEPGNPLVFKDTFSIENLEMLKQYGGFPEPLLKQDQRFLRRWHNDRMERFFKEDLRELTQIRDFGSLSLMAELLPERVASTLSINSLATNLQVNFKTASHWLDGFENFYYIFRVAPYQSGKIASVRKEKKVYLWDWPLVEEDGARVENLAAVHLLKYCRFMLEYQGWKVSLMFLRDTSGKEVDFLVTVDNKPWFAVEVKTHDKKLSPNLLYFKEKLNIPYCYQVVYRMGSDEEYEKNGVRVMPMAKFFSALV